LPTIHKKYFDIIKVSLIAERTAPVFAESLCPP
jgi:hypothetical protein